MSERLRHPIAWTLFAILIVVMVVVIFLPALFSTRWGSDFISTKLSSEIPGRIDLGDVELHWFSPQVAHSVRLQDPDGNEVAHVESISVEASLWSLLWGTTHLGRVALKKPNIDLIYGAEGSSNLHRALVRGSSPRMLPVARSGLPPLAKRRRRRLYTGTFVITDGEIRTQSPQAQPVVFHNLEISADLPARLTPVSVVATGESQQGDSKGSFSLDLRHMKLAPIDGALWLLPAKGFQGAADIQNLPMQGVDQLFAVAAPDCLGLLPALVGPTLDAEIRADGTIQASAEADHLDLELEASLSNGQFTLDKPAAFTMTITPAASDRIFSLFFGMDNIQLDSPTRLELRVPKLKVVAEEPLELRDLIGQGSLVIAPMALSDPFVGAFRIDGVRVQVEAPGGADPLTVEGEIQLSRAGQSVQVHGKSTTSHYLQEDAQTQFSLTAGRIPTDLFEPIIRREGLVPTLLGPWVTTSIQGESAHGFTDVTIQLESEALKVSPIHLRLGDNLELVDATAVHYRLRPDAWTKALGSQTAVRLDQQTELSLEIDRLSLPLTRPLTPQNSELRAVFSAPNMAFSGLPGEGLVTLNNLHLHLDGDPLSDAEIKGVVELFFPEGSGLWRDGIGDELPLTLEAKCQLSSDWQANFNRIYIWVQSHVLSLTAEASLTDGHQLRLLAPLFVRYTLTPAFAAQAAGPKLAEPVGLSLRVEPCRIDLREGRAREARVVGELSVGKTEFTGPLSPTIDKLNVTFALNDPRDTLKVGINGKTSTLHAPSQSDLEASLTLANFLSDRRFAFSEATLKGNAKLDHLPTAIWSYLIECPNLDTLIGPTTNVALEAQLSHLSPVRGESKLVLHSKQLDATAELKFTKQVTLSKPAQLTWRMAPEVFQTVMPQADFHLAKPTELTAQVEELNWPDKLQMAITLDPTSIVDPQGNRAELTGLTLSVQSESPERPIELRVKGRLATDERKGLFSANGQLLPHNKALKASLSLDEVSVPWLLRLSLIEPPLVRAADLLIGSPVTAEGKLAIVEGKGPFSLSFRSPQSTGAIDSQLTDKRLLLNQPLDVAIQITPELGATILRAFNPLLRGSLDAEQWAKLHIEPAGFSLPMWPFALEQMQIGAGTLDLGKLWASRKGTLAALLGLFPKQEERGTEVSIWTTPIPFALSNGELELRRSDMLLGRNLQVATWGSVNLVQDRVCLALGIPGSSLRQLLAMDTIKDDDYLLIPVRGTLQEAKIDWKLAAARLAAIAAKAQGKAVGAAAGAALELLAGGKKEPVPPPTTTPFPWETRN